MINIKNVPMVRVTWTDARDMETGWLDIKEILNAPLAVCQDIGWMIVNNPQKVVIMRSWTSEKNDQQGGGAVAIPKGWITHIEYLTVSYGTKTK